MTSLHAWVQRAQRMLSQHRAWALWGLVIFGIFNLGANIEVRQRYAHELEHADPRHVSISYVWELNLVERETVVAAPPLLGHIEVGIPHLLKRAVLMELSDEGDVRRYTSYLGAALNRPFQPFFVRTLTAWKEDFQASKETGKVVAYNPAEALVSKDKRLVPYRDYCVEYPPGFWLWVVPPAILSTEPHVYPVLFTLWMGVLLSAALFLCTRLGAIVSGKQGRSTSWMVGFATALCIALGPLVVMRFDSSVALLIAATLYFSFTGQYAKSGFALGLGFITKLVPVIIAPVVLVYILQTCARDRTVKSGGSFVLSALAGTLLCVVPIWFYAGPAIFDVFIYHATRPLEIESIWAAGIALQSDLVDGLAHREYSYGAINIWSPYSDVWLGVSKHVLVGGLVACTGCTVLRLMRSSSERDAQRVTSASVIVLLLLFPLLGGVFSPQYLVWILPLAACTMRERAYLQPILLLVAVGLTQYLYPVLFEDLAGIDPFAHRVSLVRTLILFCFGGLTIWHGWRRPKGASLASADSPVMSPSGQLRRT